jgi:hypothetical protein
MSMAACTLNDSYNATTELLHLEAVGHGGPYTTFPSSSLLPEMRAVGGHVPTANMYRPMLAPYL